MNREGTAGAVARAVGFILGLYTVGAEVVHLDDEAVVVPGRIELVEILDHVVRHDLVLDSQEKLAHGPGVCQRLLGVVQAEVLRVQVHAERRRLSLVLCQNILLGVDCSAR
ncbi:hypothetical protein PtrARCrB10_03177 [Pyrenophora tritici-repentis]|nr:hypothetical protein PtrARCrB10_03177 [Pyrenophora tritici-repentis]